MEKTVFLSIGPSASLFHISLQREPLDSMYKENPDLLIAIEANNHEP